MSVQTKLNERYQNILRAIIKHYIATAEPVASKTLLEEYDFSVSSATIRNIMGRLEKAGLLYQPHTSAGRIPSDSGYRIYVDKLITPSATIGVKIDQYLSQKLKSEVWSVEKLLERGAKILANLTGYIAVITMPQTSTHQIKHLQLVQVNSNQVMLIIVTDSYQTQSVLMDLSVFCGDDECSNIDSLEGELQLLSNFLNSKLQGRSFSDLSSLNWQELDEEFKVYADFIRNLLRELRQHFQSSLSSNSIMVHGISEVLRQPEFSQLDQVQMLLYLLEEEQDRLLPLIFELPELDDFNSKTVNSKVKITIGSENPLEPMHSCSLVSSIYRQGDIPMGSVGIIGPTRMLYENAIALVESAADYLSEALS